MSTLRKLLYCAVMGWPVIPTFCDNVGSIARVEGRSMQPTLNPDISRNDIVLLKRWNKYNVSRGEVVSVISPKDPSDRSVKRVVGLEGDIVFKDGKNQECVVPLGHIWIEGDHTNTSLDSNHYGAIPIGLVEAKVTWIIWPLDRFQRVEKKIKRAVITIFK